MFAKARVRNIRRSERSNKGIPPLRLGLYAGAATSNQSEPNTIEEALSGANKH